MSQDVGTVRQRRVVDKAAVESFMDRVVGDYAGANAFFMGGIGDRLGLFKDLAQRGPATSTEFAERTGLHERYVREWLGGMAAAGYLTYEPATERYTVPPEHAPVLAEEAGPWFLGCAFFDYSTYFGETFHALLDAFRNGGGVRQDLHGAEVAESIDRFTAPWFENSLVPLWLPEMPDVLSRLEGGAAVCDVGCGRGRALVKLAEAFPASTFVGYDIYAPAVKGAIQRAEEAGVDDRVRFEVRDVAQGVPGQFDVITTFDVLHDSADPEGLLGAIRAALKPDGVYLCLEINCADRPEDNIGPLGTVLYGLSLAYCLSVSLAEGGAGLGTLGLPESKLRQLALGRGYSEVARVPVEDAFCSLYVLRP
ncbi:MAG TPA: class I SAM-dependent methyltransferase [Acidimicrobiales bacterium]|nr:class I SAM-dependent methyltransferase [Acidimicrobiales bacterium]